MHLTHPTTAASASAAPRLPWTTALLCACMAWGLMAVPDSAHAARKKKSADSTASAAAQTKGSVKVKHHRSPSEENTAERDRRMYRECLGRPNAGACLGYTSRR